MISLKYDWNISIYCVTPFSYGNHFAQQSTGKLPKKFQTSKKEKKERKEKSFHFKFTLMLVWPSLAGLKVVLGQSAPV